MCDFNESDWEQDKDFYSKIVPKEGEKVDIAVIGILATGGNIVKEDGDYFFVINRFKTKVMKVKKTQCTNPNCNSPDCYNFGFVDSLSRKVTANSHGRSKEDEILNSFFVNPTDPKGLEKMNAHNKKRLDSMTLTDKVNGRAQELWDSGYGNMDNCKIEAYVRLKKEGVIQS